MARDALTMADMPNARRSRTMAGGDDAPTMMALLLLRCRADTSRHDERRSDVFIRATVTRTVPYMDGSTICTFTRIIRRANTGH